MTSCFRLDKYGLNVTTLQMNNCYTLPANTSYYQASIHRDEASKQCDQNTHDIVGYMILYSTLEIFFVNLVKIRLCIEGQIREMQPIISSSCVFVLLCTTTGIITHILRQRFQFQFCIQQKNPSTKHASQFTNIFLGLVNH